ncbi:MAG TPA: hypothetical protein PLL54_07165 [Dermatophilaceae bacterium]|jgi:hypothetical protein|nr:hypothetical protein [Dermatophilaceae bacterium]
MTDPTALPNFPPPADEHPLRGRMLDVINDLGTIPVIDDDGDIAITVGEPAQQLFVRCTDGDLPIFRVFGQWVIGDAAPADDLVRLERCNDFTLQLNVAKVGIANGNLIVTADHVVTPDTDLSPLFQLTVNLVLQVVSAWFGSWEQGRHEASESGGS